MSGQELHFDFY